MSDLAAKTELLSQVDLFRGVSLPDLENLCQSAESVHYTDGQLMFDEGDDGETVYVIEQGVVKIIVVNSGSPKQISTCFEGDIVGELALLDGRPRSARAVASGNVTAIVIHRREFLDFVIARPQVMFTLLETLTKRARRLSDLVEGNIEWLGKLAHGDFEHATGFALRLAPAMFKVTPSRPLVRASLLQATASATRSSRMFSNALARLDARDKTEQQPKVPVTPDNADQSKGGT